MSYIETVDMEIEMGRKTYHVVGKAEIVNNCTCEGAWGESHGHVEWVEIESVSVFNRKLGDFEVMDLYPELEDALKDSVADELLEEEVA